MKNLIFLFALLMVSTVATAQETKTVTLYFEANSWELTEAQKGLLAKESKGYTVRQVMGYANSLPTKECSFREQDECNSNLAQSRAYSVEEVKMEYNPYNTSMFRWQIVYSSSAKDRRVQVYMEKW